RVDESKVVDLSNTEKVNELIQKFNSDSSNVKDIFVKSGEKVYALKKGINLNETGKVESILSDLKILVTAEPTDINITVIKGIADNYNLQKSNIKLDLHEHFSGILDPEDIINECFEGSTEEKYKEAFTFMKN